MRNSRLKEGKDSLRPFLTPSPALSAVTPDVSRLGHIHAHPHPQQRPLFLLSLPLLASFVITVYFLVRVDEKGRARYVFLNIYYF